MTASKAEICKHGAADSALASNFRTAAILSSRITDDKIEIKFRVSLPGLLQMLAQGAIESPADLPESKYLLSGVKQTSSGVAPSGIPELCLCCNIPL